MDSAIRPPRRAATASGTVKTYALRGKGIPRRGTRVLERRQFIPALAPEAPALLCEFFQASSMELGIALADGVQRKEESNNSREGVTRKKATRCYSTRWRTLAPARQTAKKKCAIGHTPIQQTLFVKSVEIVS